MSADLTLMINCGQDFMSDGGAHIIGGEVLTRELYTFLPPVLKIYDNVDLV